MKIAHPVLLKGLNIFQWFFHPIPCPCLQSSCSVSCSFIAQSNWTYSLPYFTQKKKKKFHTFLKVWSNMDYFYRSSLQFGKDWLIFWSGIMQFQRGGLQSPTQLFCLRQEDPAQQPGWDGLWVVGGESRATSCQVTHPRCSESDVGQS